MYQHLERLVDGLKPGDPVVAGQLLGCTGAPASGGPHLHFALKNGDTDAFIASVPRSGVVDPSDGSSVPECAPPEVNECAPNYDPQTAQESATAQPLMFSPLDVSFTPWDPAWAQANDILDAAISIHDPSQVCDPDHTGHEVTSVFSDLASTGASELLPDLSSSAGHPSDHYQSLTDVGSLDGPQDAGTLHNLDSLAGIGGGNDAGSVQDHGTRDAAVQPDPSSNEN